MYYPGSQKTKGLIYAFVHLGSNKVTWDMRLLLRQKSSSNLNFAYGYYLKVHAFDSTFSHPLSVYSEGMHTLLRSIALMLPSKQWFGRIT